MLEKLKEKIENNYIIKKEFFENHDLDELLDMRDIAEFDSEWMRVYENLKKVEVNEKQKKVVDSIRETSFLLSYNLARSSDMASCISDDFELICKAYIMGYNDKWLNTLIMSYTKGEFPCGKLEDSEYSMEECIRILCS